MTDSSKLPPLRSRHVPPRGDPAHFTAESRLVQVQHDHRARNRRESVEVARPNCPPARRPSPLQSPLLASALWPWSEQMPRLVAALILFGSCCPVFASEPPPLSPAARYSAKIKFLRVDGGTQIIAVDTEVTGTKGTPLKTNLGGKDGLILKLELRDLNGGTPTQYLAQFRLTEKGRVLAEPVLVTTAGKPAKLTVGQEKGDRIEVEVTVSEGVSAAIESKPTGREQTNRRQPPAAAPSSYGTSLMMMVHPRLIIQEEEEEKLPVTP